MRIRLYLSVLAEPPMPALLMVSLFAWLALLLSGDSMHASAHHHTVNKTVVQMLVQSAWPWFLMLLAMMSPLLANAIHHLWARSLSRRRIRAIILFTVAYITVWMLVGAVLMLIAEQLKVLSSFWEGAAFATSLVIALVWQASPWKQSCLNRCHLQPRLSAFGIAADRDCLRFGLVKGLFCVGTCWALMLLPLVVVSAGLPLMLVIGLFMLLEQYRPARPAQWRIPLLANVLN